VTGRPPTRALRSLGQVFLNSQATAARIVRALGAGPTDPVVEVGPGRGALTGLLAASCGPLVLLEKDRDLAAALAARYSGDPRVSVVECDATTVDLDRVAPGPGPWRAVGNLPYNAGTPILFNLLRHRARFARMVLMFQREVAWRIAARPGDREYGAVSLLVQAQARVDLLFEVPPRRFIPRPAVWSALIRVEPTPADTVLQRAIDDPRFAALVHALHAQPRKTVLNSLADGLSLDRARAVALIGAAEIDPTIRPCHVTPAQAMRLWGLWKEARAA